MARPATTTAIIRTLIQAEPDREWTAKEILGIVGCSRNQVQKSLGQLVDEGTIRVAGQTSSGAFLYTTTGAEKTETTPGKPSTRPFHELRLGLQVVVVAMRLEGVTPIVTLADGRGNTWEVASAA